MSGKSQTSTVVSIRLPNEVLFTLKRRINGRRSRWASVGEYLKDRIIYDVKRSHDKGGSSLASIFGDQLK